MRTIYLLHLFLISMYMLESITMSRFGLFFSRLNDLSWVPSSSPARFCFPHSDPPYFTSEFLPASPHVSWSVIPKTGHWSLFKIFNSNDEGGLFRLFTYRAFVSASRYNPTYCFCPSVTLIHAQFMNCTSPQDPFSQKCCLWGFEGCCHKGLGQPRWSLWV